jgi:glycerophosphoryl diester phosphodiesterase
LGGDQQRLPGDHLNSVLSGNLAYWRGANRCYGALTVTDRYVRVAHGRNLDVHVWTVNEPADMRRLIDMGVDGLITDYPDRLLAVLGR